MSQTYIEAPTVSLVVVIVHRVVEPEHPHGRAGRRLTQPAMALTLTDYLQSIDVKFGINEMFFHGVI